ncbi:MAG: hypothetical protein LBB87_02585 [Nitrososphaerota archaeon]|jgi:ssDNA-binding Zn-finger/Zn-ribbon topoisomerase 1|nr:hypothetical protein [Nitrososphaerota archaeon]
MDPIIIIISSTFAIIATLIAIGVILSHGKQLKCPDCERIFNAPIMEEKYTGFGWTLPYMGNITCPKCGNKRSRRDFNKVEKQTEKAYKTHNKRLIRII